MPRDAHGAARLVAAAHSAPRAGAERWTLSTGGGGRADAGF